MEEDEVEDLDRKIKEESENSNEFDNDKTKDVNELAEFLEPGAKMFSSSESTSSSTNSRQRKSNETVGSETKTRLKHLN